MYGDSDPDQLLPRADEFAEKHRSRESVISTGTKGRFAVSYSTHHYGKPVGGVPFVRHVATVGHIPGHFPWHHMQSSATAHAQVVQRMTATVCVDQVEVNGDSDAGKIVAFLIRRETLRSDSKTFHYYMNPVISDSATNFANALFDRHGMLKWRLYGIFGHETNQGNILYIRNVSLKKEHRKRSLGCKALRRFLQMVCTDLDRPDRDEWWFAGTMSGSLETPHVPEC